MTSLLVLLALLAPQDLGLAPAVGEARLEVSVERVELGEPFELVLLVHHRAGDQPQIDASTLEVDLAWAVLEGGERTTLPDPEREDLSHTRVTWSLVALEPGELALPAPTVTLSTTTGEPAAIEVARGTVEVRAALAPGEDAPRPLVGFVGLEPESATSIPWPWFLALAIVLVAAAILFARRRAARRAVPVATEPAPLERLAALEVSEVEEPEAVRAAHFELTRALRDHLGAASTDASESAMTDEEWLAAASKRLGGERVDELEALFEDCAAVKYGGAEPTHWAARERVARARELALALGPDASEGEG